jgi:hypothetical protein
MVLDHLCGSVNLLQTPAGWSGDWVAQSPRRKTKKSYEMTRAIYKRATPLGFEAKAFLSTNHAVLRW